jgi:hypothetical protein
MRRRVGRPGLLGTVARTAVIAGTATAVSGSISNRQRAGQQQAAAQQQAAINQAAAQQLAAQQAAAHTIGPTGDDVIAQLSKLGELKASGVLDESEFAAAKARVLGMG